MTETEQKNHEALHEIADEYSRSVFTMFEQRDYVLPSMFRGLIAADMRLLAEHVAKRQHEIESVSKAIDSGIQDGMERRLARFEKACLVRSEVDAPAEAVLWMKDASGSPDGWWIMESDWPGDMGEHLWVAPDFRPGEEGPITLPILDLPEAE